MLAFIVLTAGTAVFVAAEFSLTALERSTVDANARTGGRRDKLVQRAHRTLSFQLSGAQVGISITTLITGYLAEPLVARLLEPAFAAMSLTRDVSSGLALVLALLIATSVSMVFGELVAQYLAVAKPLPTARVVAGPQVLFSMLVTPLIQLTNGTANWILRRLGIEPAEELRSARSPQELGSLVRNSARRGSLDPVTATLVDRSLQFGSRTAEELMTPRTKIETLEVDDTVADLVDAAIQTGYSRFPIVEGDLDETIGIVHVKQVFEVPPRATQDDPAGRPRAARRQGAVDARRRRRDGTAAGQRLADRAGGRRIRRHRGHGDGRGRHRGDRRRHPRRTRRTHAPTSCRRVEGWQVSGLLRIDEVADATGFRAPEGEYETIGGLVLRSWATSPKRASRSS